jgi:hypothetical protein
MANVIKLNKPTQDFKYLVRKFIENNVDEYGLTIYHISLLKVIAEYCDMPEGHCFLSFEKIEKYTGMSPRQRRRTTVDLIQKKLIYQTTYYGKPKHYMGEYFSLEYD